MSNPASIAVVGASAAGCSAVRTLRELGYDKEINLFDADERGSYERPPLSKSILMNPAQSAESISLLAATEIASANISTHWGATVTALDAEQKQLSVDSGDQFSADAIILATGGRARSLPIPGAQSNGVFRIRDFEDAESLRACLPEQGRVAVIGGGFIGAEVAASLNSIGHKILWIDAASKPLAHVLPEAICNPLLSRHQQLGVDIICNAKITSLVVEHDRVCGVALSDGQILDVDAVVLGVGMTPRSELAEQAGLDLAVGGVKVDSGQRTSAAHIYACGDVAAFDTGAGQFARDEHWQSAEHQGANAARAILGETLLDKPVPWFWSDQGELHIEMAGELGENSVVRHEGEWPVVFEMTRGRLVGVCSVNQPNAVRIGLRFLRLSLPVSADELTDTSTDLRSLLKQKSRAKG